MRKRTPGNTWELSAYPSFDVHIGAQRTGWLGIAITLGRVQAKVLGMYDGLLALSLLVGC